MPPYRFRKTIVSPAYRALTRLLREARLRTGLTQIEAARRLGCRQTFLSKIERGERRLDVIEFMTICDAYRVDPSEIIASLKRRRRR